jgi:hypothetical protein
LAGLYDRNKKIIKPLATGVAGALTGGVGAAALGGLMSGLDREGKRGIGLDLGKAARGAAEGYGTGMAGAGLKGLLTGGTSGAQAALGQYNRLPFGMGGEGAAGAAGPIAPQQAVGQGGGFFPGTGGAGANPMDALRGGKSGGGGSSLSGLLKGIRENKDLIGGAVKGAQMFMPDAGDEASLMNAETARQRLAMEQDEMNRQREEEEARRRRIAELLLPYARQQFPTYFGGQ